MSVVEVTGRKDDDWDKDNDMDDDFRPSDVEEFEDGEPGHLPKALQSKPKSGSRRKGGDSVIGSQFKMKVSLAIERTSASLRGQVMATTTPKRFAVIILTSCLLPPFVLCGMFSLPMCDPWENDLNGDGITIDGMACTFGTYRRFTRWLPTTVLCICAALALAFTIDGPMLKVYFDRRLTPWQLFWIVFNAVVGGIATLEFLTEVWHPHAPFLFIFVYTGSFSLSFMTLLWVIYKTYYQEMPADGRVEFIWKIIMIFTMLLFSVTIAGLYIAFGVGYRLLAKSKGIWYDLYIVFGVAAVRKLGLTVNLKLWTYINESRMGITQIFVLLSHSLMLSILRGSSAEDVRSIILLSLSDFVMIGLHFMKLLYGKSYLQWPDRIRNNRRISIESHGLEMVEITMYMILEELVELIVPIGYVLTVCLLYHMDNSRLFAGVGSTRFGYDQISDIGTFAFATTLVCLIESLSFTLIIYAAAKFLKIHAYNAICRFMDVNLDFYLASCNLLFCVFFLIPCTTFGCDLTFKFEWM